MNSEKKLSVRDRILEKIAHGDVQMHSRTYFVLQVAALSVLAAIVLLITVFIGNFLFFMLRLNGHDTLLFNGWHGWVVFLRVFPWPLLILAILLSAVLVWLLRKFQFGYRTPILFVFSVLVLLALSTGFLLDKVTPLNDLLLHDADCDTLPHPLDAVYKGARRSPPPGTAYRGTVLATTTDSVILMDPDSDATTTVLLPKDRAGMIVPYMLGESVFVVGELDAAGLVQAYAIHSIDEKGIPHPHDTERCER